METVTASTAPKSREDLNWAVVAHLSSFVAAWFALGALGPFVVWMIKGRDSEFVREHAVAAVNFNLTILIGVFLGALLILFAGIGIIFLALVGLIYLIETLRAAIAASKGKSFGYGAAIAFFK